MECMQLDLASLSSVRAFAQQFLTREIPLHVLVCNAGVFSGSYRCVIVQKEGIIGLQCSCPGGEEGCVQLRGSAVEGCVQCGRVCAVAQG